MVFRYICIKSGSIGCKATLHYRGEHLLPILEGIHTCSKGSHQSLGAINIRQSCQKKASNTEGLITSRQIFDLECQK